MKKVYIKPFIIGHKIVIPSLLQGTEGVGNKLGSPDSPPNSNESKSAYNRGIFFDDESPAQSATKEQDFAYGL